MEDQKTPDEQKVEAIGRGILIRQLLQAGLEVALPIRDHGIDLIAYLDTDEQLGKFAAFPIQMKAATSESFELWRKYEKFHNLILVYVWNVDDGFEPVIYALTYKHALHILEKVGETDKTKTVSWNEKGVYRDTSPSETLRKHLIDHHLMTPKRWHTLLLEMSNSGE